MYFEWTKDASNVVSVHISESEDEEEEEEAEGMVVCLSSLLVVHEYSMYLRNLKTSLIIVKYSFACLEMPTQTHSTTDYILFSTLPSATDGSI